MANKRKYLLGVLVFCAMAVGVTAIMVLYRFRGSVKVVPGEDIPGPEAVFYRQTDERWAEDFLGDSVYTMKSSGCLVTCIAAALQMSDNVIAGGDGESMNGKKTPGELNLIFSQNHVYDSQGNLQWAQLAGLEHIQVDVSEAVSAELIQDYLQMDRYPIVRVRVKGYGNFHYVLVVAAQNGMFYCMDPLNQDEKLLPLSNYWNRVYAIRCVYPE